jgi:hypothetical protein
MDRRAFRLVRRFGVEHKRQRFVRDADYVARVLGLGPRLGDDCGNPFAAIARNADRSRIATDLWGIDADHEWVGCCRKLGASERTAHTRHRERFARVDVENMAGREIRGHQGDVKRPGQIDIACKTALANYKSTMLASTPLGGNETVSLQIRHGPGW